MLNKINILSPQILVSFKIWFIFLLISFCLLFAYRELVYFQFGSYLLPGDQVYYYGLIMEQVNGMRLNGFSSFELAPAGQPVVGVASLLYYFFQSEFSMLIFNAVLHSLSVFFLFLLLSKWFSRVVAVVAVTPVLFAPYMAMWFAGPNKESFSLLGVMMFFYGLSGSRSNDIYRVNFIWCLFGVLLIACARPYLNQVLIPCAVFFVLVYFYRVFRFWRLKYVLSLFGAVFLVFNMAFFAVGAVSSDTISSLYRLEKRNNGDLVWERCLDSVAGWEDAELLPKFVNDRFKAIAGHRCLIFSLLDTHSNSAATVAGIEGLEFMPVSSGEMIAHLPQAMLTGVFSPLPSHWFIQPEGKFSFFYFWSSVESILLFLFFCAYICYVFKKRVFLGAFPIISSIYVLTVYGMSTPYIAALYRYRYPFIAILICFGLAVLVRLAVIMVSRCKRDLEVV